jgi:3-deoxy-7-phosphoheptulonate synthase
VLTHEARKPVLRIGRIAGQYAKPRSSGMERVGEHVLPSYRGDLVNDAAPDPAARIPDPDRLLQGYHHAAASLNYLRSLIEGGFADLHHPERWDLAFIQRSPRRDAYMRTVSSIMDSIAFMNTVGAASAEALRRIELYTSHESLVLPYEEALTRHVPDRGYLNLGAHLLWVGYRTADIEGAHVEYLRGIENPIGLKVGPGVEPRQLLTLLERVDPERQPGRVTLISRFGAEGVADGLPPLLRAVRAAGHPVVWSCDPMHGNTETVEGRKTRRVEAMFSELEQTFRLHGSHGTVLGGVHFEMTGEDVTECIGGWVDVRAQDLSRSYGTACDPRLNGSQALEMAFRIAELLRMG